MVKHLPTVLYMHGSEVQTSKVRKAFDSSFSVYNFIRDVYKDFVFIPRMRSFCKYVDENYSLVTPSEWMWKEAENELSMQLNNVYIIPNGIDVNLFPFKEKSAEQLKRLITIRPLSSKKYAVDKAIEFLSHLPKDYSLDIYGKGNLKSGLVALCNKLGVNDRVYFHEDFIHRKDLPKMLEQYGAFIATTRMDAQGVMMCEAMASGNLIVTSDNTAIPEFVENFNNGLCGNDLKKLSDEYLSLTSNVSNLNVILNNARVSMEKISLEKMASEEIKVLEKYVH